MASQSPARRYAHGRCYTPSHDAGKHVRMADRHGTFTAYACDDVNRVAPFASGIDSVFPFAYDDAGRRTSLSFPNRTHVSHK